MESGQAQAMVASGSDAADAITLSQQKARGVESWYAKRFFNAAVAGFAENTAATLNLNNPSATDCKEHRAQ